MKLENGKTYRTRDGSRTTTVWVYSDFGGSGFASGIECFTEDGYYIESGVEHSLDLVEEVPGVEYHGEQQK